MDYLSQILASPDQERTVTIKTKPQTKKDTPPEMPMDGQSANLPGSVMDLMQMQSRAFQDPNLSTIQGMIGQPATARELDNASMYQNRLDRRERARSQTGLDYMLQMLLEGGYKSDPTDRSTEQNWYGAVPGI